VETKVVDETETTIAPLSRRGPLFAMILGTLRSLHLPVSSPHFVRNKQNVTFITHVLNKRRILTWMLLPTAMIYGWILPRPQYSTPRKNARSEGRCNIAPNQQPRFLDSPLYSPFRSSRTTTQQNMALIPLPVEDLQELLMVGSPSGSQYAAYWGRTKREKYNYLVESVIVGFIGSFFSYFLSFVVGGFVATIIGCLFFFWAILSADFKARQRNWEFLGGRPLVDPWMLDEDDFGRNDEGLFGSLLLGRVDDVCVVEDTAAVKEYDLDDFQDYSREDDELEQIAGTPYLLRLRVSDDEGRELQVHARLLEEYLGIQQGMPASAILLSTSASFSSLAALTDVYIPDEGCFVGDYPYLNPTETEALFADDDELWKMLQSQSYGDVADNDIEDKGEDPNDTEFNNGRNEKVLVRRGRRRR
jgi:hypothetical protein